MADKESGSSEVTPAKVEEKKKSWADVAEEESEAELKKLEELTVSDSKGADPGLLEDPDDSQIKAVVSGDTVYTSALKFEDLNLSDDLIKGLYVEMGFSRPSKYKA
ncbi:DEAD-box ATP-dependent RNA helicase 38-like isoform X2 [Carex littledalei]|uniref:DEAD-box ATP-dependent RNA helicase 38-like isoform X2 n=1 Tax=Carex littledalei TaxID=544730 RepID=A0A833QQ10_9POAL|nr:DEAD-box ATP-dependent RNA helicase 38-like isoform X2 [Carex littledalei]